MRLHKIEDSDSQIAWCSDEWNESDWPVRFVLRCQYLEYWSEEMAREVGKYCVEIHAVSEAALGEEGVKSVRQCSGWSQEDWDSMGPEWKALEIVSYGSSARLWGRCGNNKHKLLREARKELKMIQFLFGFAMDRPINALGATGWDWIKGNQLGSYAR
jgi:hypothetical protein